jgi:hypothetical protein
MRSPVPVDAKTIGKIIFVLAVTVVGGFFALMNGTYGALGVRAAFEEHLALSEAGLVYWTLLLIAILCAAAVIAAWVLLFRRRETPPQKAALK